MNEENYAQNLWKANYLTKILKIETFNIIMSLEKGAGIPYKAIQINKSASCTSIIYTLFLKKFKRSKSPLTIAR